MKRPKRLLDPKWPALVFLGIAGIFGGVLFFRWLAGTWTPSVGGAERAFWSLTIGLLLGLQSFIFYYLKGDVYVRESLASKYRRWRDLPWWVWAIYIVAMSMGQLTYTAGKMHEGPERFAGLFLGISCGFWFSRGFYKRMRELYEQDQAAVSPVELPGPPGVKAGE